MTGLLVVNIEPIQAEDQQDVGFPEEVEILDTIEVPGTAVIQEEREIHLLIPEVRTLGPLPLDGFIPRPAASLPRTSLNISRIARDPIADIHGVRKAAYPTKSERPPYPRFAREQGWEGTVVLRLRIGTDGTVGSAKTQKSSGFPILDESALQTVQHWRFHPAKDGEVPIPVTVDLPIRFDLGEEE